MALCQQTPSQVSIQSLIWSWAETLKRFEEPWQKSNYDLRFLSRNRFPITLMTFCFPFTPPFFKMRRSRDGVGVPNVQEQWAPSIPYRSVRWTEPIMVKCFSWASTAAWDELYEDCCHSLSKSKRGQEDSSHSFHKENFWFKWNGGGRIHGGFFFFFFPTISWPFISGSRWSKACQHYRSLKKLLKMKT